MVSAHLEESGSVGFCAEYRFCWPTLRANCESIAQERLVFFRSVLNLDLAIYPNGHIQLIRTLPESLSDYPE